MPNLEQVMRETHKLVSKNPLDKVRKKYLKTLHAYTGRNVIAYYSAFLQKTHDTPMLFAFNDLDKNAFMQTIHGLDKSKGLDLILHTPGGDIAATESIVKYLKAVFGNDIRAIIPQMAMSAGTMLALSCKEILMGKQSNIGPIDPQFGNISCAAILEEFDKAKECVKNEPSSTSLWQSIINKYRPAFLGDCEKCINWANEMTIEWLSANMLSGHEDPEKDAKEIAQVLGSHEMTFAHNRHIHIDECKNLGINVTAIEDCSKQKIDKCVDFQDCVLTVHHAYMQTFLNSTAIKIVENHTGNAMIFNNTRQK